LAVSLAEIWGSSIELSSTKVDCSYSITTGSTVCATIGAAVSVILPRFSFGMVGLIYDFFSSTLTSLDSSTGLSTFGFASTGFLATSGTFSSTFF
jgi:hypothetical protein